MTWVAAGQIPEILDVNRLDDEGVRAAFASFDDSAQLATLADRNHEHVWIKALLLQPIQQGHAIAILGVDVDEEDWFVVAGFKMRPGAAGGFNDRYRRGKSGLTQRILERARISSLRFHNEDPCHAR